MKLKPPSPIIAFPLALVIAGAVFVAPALGHVGGDTRPADLQAQVQDIEHRLDAIVGGQTRKWSCHIGKLNADYGGSFELNHRIESEDGGPYYRLSVPAVFTTTVVETPEDKGYSQCIEIK